MKPEVDSKKRVMPIEMSDLWFLERKMRVTIYKGENSEQLAHGGYAAVTLPEVEPATSGSRLRCHHEPCIDVWHDNISSVWILCNIIYRHWLCTQMARTLHSAVYWCTWVRLKLLTPSNCRWRRRSWSRWAVSWRTSASWPHWPSTASYTWCEHDDCASTTRCNKKNVSAWDHTQTHSRTIFALAASYLITSLQSLIHNAQQYYLWIQQN